MEAMRRERDDAEAHAAELSERLARLQKNHADVCEQRNRLLVLNDPENTQNARERIPLEYADARDLLIKELNPEQEFRQIVRVLMKKYKDLRQVYRYYASTSYSSTAAATRLKLSMKLEDVVALASQQGAGPRTALDKVYVPHDALKPADEKMGMSDFHRMCRDMELDQPGYGEPGEIGAVPVGRSALEQIYVKCVSSGGGGSFSGSGGGSGMEFRNFLEGLLRLALARYPKVGAVQVEFKLMIYRLKAPGFKP
jgi:hypothetical protein